MLEYKSMNTPMETKLKLLVDTLSELVDATLYKPRLLGAGSGSGSGSGKRRFSKISRSWIYIYIYIYIYIKHAKC
jgi:hypothetical protein